MMQHQQRPLATVQRCSRLPELAVLYSVPALFPRCHIHLRHSGNDLLPLPLLANPFCFLSFCFLNICFVIRSTSLTDFTV